MGTRGGYWLRGCSGAVDDNDTHDPSRDGTRCVYGYYMRAEEPQP